MLAERMRYVIIRIVTKYPAGEAFYIDKNDQQFESWEMAKRELDIRVHNNPATNFAIAMMEHTYTGNIQVVRGDE